MVLDQCSHYMILYEYGSGSLFNTEELSAPYFNMHLLSRYFIYP
uniref:Uncharacterized protein n=1 Tax=Anguilla anguilla TaxID=7936 RepID=A0A0E9XSL3_ANGAN